MKPATEPDQTTAVLETTTTRRSRIVPAISEQSTTKPDLWQYLLALGDRQDEWARHMIYVYRTAPPPSTPVLKCSSQWVQMPNGSRVLIGDQQEMEFALRDNFGGGQYRIMVKRGPQLVTAETTEINAPVRPISVPIDQSAPSSQPMISSVASGGDSTAMIAGKAIDTIAGQEHQAVTIGIGALNAAANVVRQISERAVSAPAGGDLMTQFLAAAMQRLLQPPPDPLDTLTKLMSVMREVNPQRGQDETTSQIMKTALERLLNPPPNGAPVSATAELVRSLPAIGTQFVEGVRAYAQARQAELQMMEMQRRAPAAAPAAASGTAQVLPPVAPVPQPTQPSGNGAPSMDFVERKIVEIIQRPLSAEQAADEAMAFLQELDANATSELAKLGEAGLIQFFQNRPLLRPATNNMPRLIEFIRAFLKMHAEDLAANGAQPPAKQPLPN